MGCVAYAQEWRSREKTCFRLCFLVCTSLLLANPARAPRAKSAGEMRLARADRRTRPRSEAPVRSAQDGERMGNSWWGRAGSSQKDGGGNSRSRCSLIVEADVPSFKISHLAMPSWKRCEESGDGSGGEKVTSARAVRREPIAADRLISDRPLLKIGRVPLRVPQVATRVIRSDNLLQNECG